MTDRLNDSSLLWHMETLSQQGHPDPTGFVAQLEANDDNDNVSGITLDKAQQVGVTSIDEPVMSTFAAMRYDLENARQGVDPDALRQQLNPQTASRAIRGRERIDQRVNNALMNGVQPVNPFINEGGQLVLQRGRHTPVDEMDVSDDALLKEITNLMDTY